MVRNGQSVRLQSGGWAYLATWMDLFSRKIAGWQVAGSMTAAAPVQRTVELSAPRRQNTSL